MRFHVRQTAVYAGMAAAPNLSAQPAAELLAVRCPLDIRLPVQAGLSIHAAALRAFRTKKTQSSILGKLCLFQCNMLLDLSSIKYPFKKYFSVSIRHLPLRDSPRECPVTVFCKLKGRKPSGFLPASFSFHISYLSLRLGIDDLSLIVRAAGLADSVRHHQRAALAALYQGRSAHFPVRSSLVSSGFGRFILRADRHYLHLLVLTKYIHDCRHSGVWNEGIAAALPFV